MQQHQRRADEASEFAVTDSTAHLQRELQTRGEEEQSVLEQLSQFEGISYSVNWLYRIRETTVSTKMITYLILRE